MSKNAGHYNVAPRFTPGSPALVSEEIARRVAAQEVRAFEPAKQGVYGEADKAKAEHLGLRGIVEFRTERGSGKKHGWEILDLCTGERFFRLCDDALRKLGWTFYEDLGSGLKKVVDEHAPRDVVNPKRAHYKIDGYIGAPDIKVYHPSLITDESHTPWK